MSLPKAIASGPSAETPGAVKPLRVALGAGVLAALYLLMLFVASPVPRKFLAITGGATTDVERQGGLEMIWLPPSGMSEREVIARFHAGDDRVQVRRDNDALVIRVPGIRREEVAAMAKRLGGEDGLEFHRVLRVEEMMQLVRVSGLPMNGAKPVDIDIDQWSPEDLGSTRTDYYLIGTSREAIEAVLADAAKQGWALPQGTRIAYERFETERGTLWRTYVIDERAELDGTAIANAVASYDPNTNRPIVLLDFTREGGEAFGRLTGEIVGEKLATMLGGQVMSAPIINGAIRGGRASITMGGSDPMTQERERDNLVATLRAGVLPKGGRVVDARYVEPIDDVPQQWIARGMIALGGGALVALLVWMVVRITRPVRRRPIVRPDARVSWSRVGVTLLGPVALYFLTDIFVLGIDKEELAFVISGPFQHATVEQLSFGALGIMPVINAYIFVELLALLVPSWRRRRHAGPDARTPINAAVVITAGTLLFVQSWFIVQYLYGLSLGGAEVLEPGFGPQALVIGSLAVGTLVLAGIAALIREHGLGNGYGVLVTSSWLIHVGTMVWHSQSSLRVDVAIHLLAAITIAIPIVTVLRWRISRLGEAPLRVPTSSIAPLGEAGGLAVLVTVLATLPVEDLTMKVYEWSMVAGSHDGLLAALLVAFAVLWSHAFARPSITRKLAERVGLTAPSRATWWHATLLSTALLLLVGAVALATEVARPTTIIVHAMTFAIVAAVVLDIVDDVRGRRVEMLRVWSLHQAQYTDLVARALDEAGIPYHFSSANLKTLLAFFGPFAPVDVWVPASHAPAARTKLGELFE